MTDRPGSFAEKLAEAELKCAEAWLKALKARRAADKAEREEEAARTRWAEIIAEWDASRQNGADGGEP
jgi:hypothetical protein